MNKDKKDLAASIRQRLLNHAREQGLEFNLILKRFANERLLYRLSISNYRDQFVLKGATLFSVWLDAPNRPTRDIDFLSVGSNDPGELENLIADVCRIESPDGLRFDPESVRGAEIREGEEYRGVRVTLSVYLGKAKIGVQIDVGFGDAVTPPPLLVEIPVLLDLPVPEMRVYPRETVIAEKFEAMVKLGMPNSRMKDFWDLYFLIKASKFDDETLHKALISTFKRRGTKFPSEIPIALTGHFMMDEKKRKQWRAFLQKNQLDQNLTIDEVVVFLRSFFEPIIKDLHKQIQ